MRAAPTKSGGRSVAWLVVVAACGPSEATFVVDYTDAYCDYYLECGDPAQLVFDGIDSLESCRALYGPGVAERGSACKVDKGPAGRCLDLMETMACPEEGAVIDDSLPADCEAAWQKCLGEAAE
jgi:hypothetical protein